MNSGSHQRPVPELPRLQGDLRARGDHHARPPGAQRCQRLPAQRRNRQADPRPAGLGQAHPGEHGHVPGGPAHVPAGQQAGSRGADVDAGRHRRRACSPGGTTSAPTTRTAACTARPSRSIAGTRTTRNTWSTASPSPRVGVVWSQQNTDFYGRDDAEVLVELALARHHPGADPGAHSLPAGPRRSHRPRCRGSSPCWSCRTSAPCRTRRSPASGALLSAAAACWPPARAACSTNGATRAPISPWRICSARTLSDPQPRGATKPGAESERQRHAPHLPAAVTRNCRARVDGPQAGAEPRRQRRAPRRAARLRGDGHPAVRRHAGDR